MGLPRDDRVTDRRTRRRSPEAQRFGAGAGDVVPFHARESVAQRLEREWAERDRAEQAQRAELERRRAERDRAIEQRRPRGGAGGGGGGGGGSGGGRRDRAAARGAPGGATRTAWESGSRRRAQGA